MTPLATKLCGLIAANGPMSVADYMALCLGDPEHGYYMTRDPFGAAGDFTTAPEVSQMFGEIVGAWLIHAWELAGSPLPVRLVELGPGRGTLMADILRVAAAARLPANDLRVHLVETSPLLREGQAATLCGAFPGSTIAWHLCLADVPAGPLLLVANEFFDALPIRQFVQSGGRWRERVIGLDREGRLGFGLGTRILSDGPLSAEDGALLEVSHTAEAVAAEIAERILASGGAALITDYGHCGGFSDTLQALRRHAFCDPLDQPGAADLTAHVDFSALARAALSAGAAVHGPIPQRDFLLPLGLLERAGQLGADGDAALRASLETAVERLAGSDAMGGLFKAMAITRPGLLPPPFAPLQPN